MSYSLTFPSVLLAGDDSAAYQQLLKCLLDEHRPTSATETLLVEKMAQSYWRLNRVRLRQDRALQAEPLNPELLSLLDRKAATHERTFFKSLETLKKLRQERLAKAPADFVSQNAGDVDFFKLRPV